MMRRNYQKGGAATVALEQEYYDAYQGFYDSLADADYARILAMLPAPPRLGAMLEVGCGSGALGLRLQSRFSSAFNVGLDVSHGLLLKHPFTPVLGNGQFLPFPDARFDLVAASAALHHIHNLEFTLREIFRVLKPGGQVLFIEPNADHPYRRLVVDGGFMRRYFLQTSDESIFPQDLTLLMRTLGFAETHFAYATFQNRHPSILGKMQSLISALPYPRALARFVHPWFVLVGVK